MEKPQRDIYYKGYVAGYRDGVAAALDGRITKMIESDITNLPIEAMELSVRAYNCLKRAGCVSIADAAALSERTIAIMRNLGAKTASEIAQSMDARGICYSAWSKYL